MDNIRAKLSRKLSVRDKNGKSFLQRHVASPHSHLTTTTANFDEHDDADDETTGNLHREMEEAETGNYDAGKPGSFLNRLISHGNKKTEDDLAREAK